MILMHKDIPVADVVIQGGDIISVPEVFNEKHLPMGTATPYKQLLPKTLSNWQKMRAIPSERQDIGRIEQALQCSVPEAVIKSLAVSLTDCYWFKPADTDLQWKDVNFHENPFSADFSEAILDKAPKQILDFHIPDITTDGLLSKAWVYMDNVPMLVKRGDFGEYAHGKNLLSANEVAAYKVALEMGINHVPYIPVVISATEEIACASPCFVTEPHQEYVNALQIMQHENRPGMELYRYFCQLGLQKEIDQMILFDYIIHNTDRHEKNFGIIRDAETLEPTGMAPLYDSGSSFYWDHSQNDIKPFARMRNSQLELLVNSPCDIPDPKTVKTILEETYEIFGIDEKNFADACKDIDATYEQLTMRELYQGKECNVEDMEL